MKAKIKYYLIAAVALVVLGIAIIGLGKALGGRGKGVSFFKKTEATQIITSDSIVQDVAYITEFDKLEIDCSSVDIIIEEGDDFGLEYRVYDYQKPEIAQSSDMLRIKQPKHDYSFNIGVSLDMSGIYYKLTIPKGTSVKVDLGSTSGSIRISNVDVYGSVTSTSGSIKLNDINSKDLNVASTSGGVSLENLEADVLEVKSTSGSFSASNVKADEIKQSSTSGSAHIDKLSADKVSFATTSGSIKAEDAEVGSITAKSSSGSIRFVLEKVHEISCKATSGGVKLTLPGSESDYDYSLECTSGSIKVGGAKMSHEYETNRSGKKVQVSTTSGSINIEF